MNGRLPESAASLRPLLWLVAAAVFMQMLDTTIVNTALPAMARDLEQSPLRMQAVVVAYALTVAMLIPASGWLSDRLGTRRIFVAAIVLFTLGSLACALSQNLTQLVLARVLQGMGGAMLLPVGRLAVLRAVPRKDFLAAMSFVTVPGLIGPLVGPTLGGWLVEVASWHWIFLINLPLGAIGTLAAMRWMPDLRMPVPRFDLIGYGLLAFGMVAVSLSLDGLTDRDSRRAALVVLLVFGLAGLVAYWLHAARSERPLFPLALFRVHSYSVGLLGNLFSRLGSGGMPFLIPLLLQVGLGHSPMRAGMMMIPMALAGMSSKRIVVPLVQRWGYRRVLVGNTVLVGLAMASFALVRSGQPLWLHIVQFAAFGAVNSLQFTAMNTLVLRDLDNEQASSGNSLLSMVMMLAISMGVAVAGGLLGVFGEHAGAGADTLRAFRWSFVCLGAMTMASAFIFAQVRDMHRVPEAAVKRADPG
ncbi:multidrug transporter subunit MdtD [Pseudoxanthomonas mexicana]|uniref:multidrug transporter subunit MdtD n=1 Tax=Pseudoxanthomonas mexicana TaxID=128785 RepID=UPI00398B7A87